MLFFQPTLTVLVNKFNANFHTFPPHNKINVVYQKMPFYSHSKPRVLHGGLNLEIPLAFWQRRFPCSSTAAHKSLTRSVQAVVWTVPSRKLLGDTHAWWQWALEIRASKDVDTKVHTSCAQPGGGKSSRSQSEGANEQAGGIHCNRACWRGGEQHLGFVAGSRAGQLCARGLFCVGDVLHRENSTDTAGDRAVSVPTWTVLWWFLRFIF